MVLQMVTGCRIVLNNVGVAKDCWGREVWLGIVNNVKCY